MEKSTPSPVLIHYQAHMRGVDAGDQLQDYHIIQNKDHESWHCFPLYTMDMSIVNSLVIYRTNMQN